jgi:hypothetical protein
MQGLCPLRHVVCGKQALGCGALEIPIGEQRGGIAAVYGREFDVGRLDLRDRLLLEFAQGLVTLRPESRDSLVVFVIGVFLAAVLAVELSPALLKPLPYGLGPTLRFVMCLAYSAYSHHSYQVRLNSLAHHAAFGHQW